MDTLITTIANRDTIGLPAYKLIEDKPSSSIYIQDEGTEVDKANLLLSFSGRKAALVIDRKQLPIAVIKKHLWMGRVTGRYRIILSNIPSSFDVGVDVSSATYKIFLFKGPFILKNPNNWFLEIKSEFNLVNDQSGQTKKKRQLYKWKRLPDGTWNLIALVKRKPILMALFDPSHFQLFLLNLRLSKLSQILIAISISFIHFR